MWPVVVAIMVVLAGVGVAVGISATNDRGAEVVEQGSTPPGQAAAEEVEVPDFVALVGESEYTKDDALTGVSDNPQRYGDADLADEYRAIAEEAGFEIVFVVHGAYDEVFSHGQASRPIAQEPSPGEMVVRGSMVKLVVIKLEAEQASQPPAITVETGDSFCLIDSIEAINGVMYLTVDYVQWVDGEYHEGGYQNQNPKLRTFKLAPDAELAAYDYDRLVLEPITDDELLAMYSQGKTVDTYWQVKVIGGVVNSFTAPYSQ
ncbi:MAG: PASTA domain-containing protein [Coriobacteriia bacterium]|nr:PASTA domain-containing protein [Coriobacteriia bacterium]